MESGNREVIDASLDSIQGGKGADMSEMTSNLVGDHLPVSIKKISFCHLMLAN